ncbi:MAG: HD domain-containing protein, partial [Bacteroidales bacterium]|nr:HD domain-containing protein [Bacteroidales bacterium]
MKNQIIDFDQIVEEQKKLFFQGILSGKTEEEMKQIREAYELAYKAHLPQKRNSGEPYILHPIAVARIIGEELKLGTNSIIAALLHDVVEDTPYTIDQIQEQFGDDVAFLVQAVTKEKKVVYEMSKQLDNFRKMLDSIHFDIRALLIKL